MKHRIAIAIESSNSRGMGHLFRSLLYVDYLRRHDGDYIYLINDNKPSLEILDNRGIEYILVDYADVETNWESKIIKENKIDIWFNDKFTTSIEMARHIKDTGILFSCLDDVGEGAFLSDVFFAGMIAPTNSKDVGKKNYVGTEYVTLNKEIDGYKRKRTEIDSIVVSLGGSDPFEMTAEIVKELLKYEYDVSVVIGPNYKKKDELLRINKGRFPIYQNVDSLIRFFDGFDLAITGGGLTCCEAAAMGLPSLIMANATHEINTGRYMERLGISRFLGDHTGWNKDILKEIHSLPVVEMSQKGMKQFDTGAVKRIFDVIYENVGGENE